MNEKPFPPCPRCAKSDRFTDLGKHTTDFQGIARIQFCLRCGIILLLVLEPGHREPIPDPRRN